MKKIETLIFDFDGTLVDSEFFYFECLNLSLASFDLKYDYDFYLLNLAGTPTVQCLSDIIKMNHLNIDIEELFNRNKAIVSERMAVSEVQFMPYAIEFLEYIKSKDLTMALVTGSTRLEVDMTFAKTDLAKYFKTVVTSSDVKKSKPDPESYLLALKQLGISKDTSLVFEDTYNGIKSAKAAGLTCFGIQHYEPIHEKISNADLIFKDLNEAKSFLISKSLL